MRQSTNKTLHKMVVLWLLLSMSMVLSLSAAPIKIMFIGDSITEGGGGIPDNPDANKSEYTSGLIQAVNQISYRGKLFDLLVEDGYSIGGATDDLDFVGSRTSGSSYPTAFDMNHQAVSGYTSKQVRDGIDGWLTVHPTDIVLLHIGTNDPDGIHIGSDTDANDANTTVNNVKQILNTIFTKNPNTKVFVARIIEARRAHGFAGGIDGTPWNTNDLNNQISTMVANHTKTANIKMVNMQTGADIIYDPCGITLGDMQPYQIHPNGGTYYDYHPNHKGYAKMAQKWFDELIASDWLEPIVPATSTDHFWTLESGSPYTDSNGSSHATCTGAACPQTLVGKVGNAVSFTNTATHKEVLATNVDGYTVDESYTVEFWMNPEGNTTAGNEVVVRHGSLWIGRNNTALRYSLPGGSLNNTNVGELNTGEWNHVAVVYDTASAEAKAYINGSETSTSTITPTALTDTFFYIGHYYATDNNNTTFGYKGAVDEVAVYRRVLTAVEVSAHYAAGGGADNNETNSTADTEAPVITLTGANEQNITVGTAYTELGATVTDNNDTNVQVVIDNSEVNTSKVGTYTVRYNAQDVADNNATQVTRTVHVVAAVVDDTEAPVITLTGANEQNITVGTAYTELGATVTDNNDTNVQVVIDNSEVNTSKVGTYTVRYNAQDVADNNATQVTRTVHVVAAVVDDTEAPVITLTEPNPQQLAVGNEYTELGATATDNVDGDLTDKIDTDASNVNTDAEGNYTVTYNVSDAAGNVAVEVNRTVVITAPIDVNDTNSTDTDGDGIADEDDLDIDGDGVNNENDAFPLDAEENSDLDGDGIGDNADLDDDNNGIPDTEEQTWTNYNANTKTAIVKGTEIKSVGLDVMPSVSGGFLTLKHVFGTQEAYVSVKENGELKTGFKSNGEDDSTLKSGTFFKAGTKSAIMKDANEVAIRTIAKFNKNETFEIGGK